MAASGSGGTAPPNIIFIFPDQWRGDCLSFLGHPTVETPFLDQMAHEGVCFTNAFTPCPSCIAARAALMTGMTPSEAGRMGYRDGVPWNYQVLFPQLLRDHGYQTMCVGKTHFHPTRAHLGFEELELYEMPYQDWNQPSDYHLWLREKSNGLIRDTALDLDSNSMSVVHPWAHSEELHPNTWNITRGIELLERHDPTRPFFLQLSFHRPHPPLDPVLSYFERYLQKELPKPPIGDWATDNAQPVKTVYPGMGIIPAAQLDRARRAYYAQISHLDYQIGRLIRHLRGRKMLANTWLVFAADHGELLGDHHLYRKANAFQGSMQIPLIVRPPVGDQWAQDRICEQPTVLQDLAPTFLELAGVPKPEQMSAQSLCPQLQDPAAPGREFIHSEHAPAWQCVTDGREKFIWHTLSDRRWFFDLSTDPQEKIDLSADPGHRVRLAWWEKRLVDILSARPADGLSDGKNLLPGNSFPAVREELLPKC
ncbi:MAG: sulfatase-like hydrolase/transferase [Oligosphaeraceae bacterium]|nr:sulfatase-like hydrolase/transferase [Oligosphaeraceae bacterium]